MSNNYLLVIIFAFVAFQGWHQIQRPASVVTAEEIPTFEFSSNLSSKNDPIQKKATGVPAFKFDNYTLTPVAEFQVAGRVLGAKNYRNGRTADLSPVDLAMGWGPMADQSVLKSVDIAQGGRFYSWRVEQFPIPRDDIVQHSANMHMVPANREVAQQLKGVEQGQLVRFKGYLLNIEADDGWYWRSSITRKDSGDGACELVLIDTIETVSL